MWQGCDALYFLAFTISCSHSCIILGSFSGIMTTFQHNWNTTYVCIQFHPLRTRECIELVGVQHHLKQVEACAEASDTVRIVGSYEFVICFVGQSDVFSFVIGSCCIHQLFPSLPCLDRMGKINNKLFGGGAERFELLLTQNSQMYRAVYKIFSITSKVPRRDEKVQSLTYLNS